MAGVRPVLAALTGLVLLTPALVSPAQAMPKFRLLAAPQLHLTGGRELWELDRRVMPCTYCHVKESGGAPWNPFGQAIRDAFRSEAQAGRAVKFPQALFALLGQGGDADNDGYADALEVYARTLPGDPRSHPDQPAASVKAAFEKAGGVAQFAPVPAQKPDTPTPGAPGR